MGLISDTHGYFDDGVVDAFAGVEAILHAGDVGKAEVLRRLAALAPLHAVQGNNDAPLAELELPLRLDIELAGRGVHLVHQLPDARPPADCAVVVYGHSHRALVERRGGVLYVNPGAAGRAGFHRLQTVALLDISAAGIDARIVELGPRLLLAAARTTARRSG